MGYRQFPAQLFFNQGFRGLRVIAALIGHFQRDFARATGQAGRATTQWAGETDVVVILALQPEQRAAARIFWRADADFAVDLPAVEAGQLLFVLAPLGLVALTLDRFAGNEARATGEQGDEAEK